jgi:hypothetical protein
MGFDDRLLWLIFGVIIGFLLGYLTHWIRDTTEKLERITHRLDKIKEELDEVDDLVKQYHPPKKSSRRSRNERGVLTTRLGMNVSLGIVVALTAFAAFQSQRAVNGVHNSQHRETAVTTCTTQILKSTIKILDVRSEFTRNQAAANVDLQRAQSEMISVLLHEPPYSNERQLNAFKAYFQALNDFVEANGKSETSAKENKYPTVTEFNACVQKELEREG